MGLEEMGEMEEMEGWEALVGEEGTEAMLVLEASVWSRHRSLGCSCW